jgi:IclR family transcriptional regulator, KDG regulon repressor
MSSLENGLRILSLLGPSRPILRVGEVCRDLEIPKASVSRLLRTLADAGVLERDARDGGYRVGVRSLDLGRLYLADHGLLDLITNAIDMLVAEFGFTGHAGIVVGAERVLLVAKQGTYPLQHIAGVAERKPVFDSIIGRAILARRSDDEILAVLGLHNAQDVVNGLHGEAALKEIDAIRQQRVAFSSSLITPGISSVGAAVADPSRDEVLGFCLSYPAAAADETMRQRMRDEVHKFASAIGRRVHDQVWMHAKDEQLKS